MESFRDHSRRSNQSVGESISLGLFEYFRFRDADIETEQG